MVKSKKGETDFWYMEMIESFILQIQNIAINSAAERSRTNHSHNTARWAMSLSKGDVEGMKQLLLKLNFIREDLGLQTRAKGKEYRPE